MNKILFISILSTLLLASCHKEDFTYAAKIGLVEVDSASASFAVSQHFSGEGNITTQGVIYSFDPNPQNWHPKEYVSGNGQNYTVTVENLEADTTYYIRPYIYYKSEYYYGDDISFRTDTIPYSEMGAPGPAGGRIFYLNGNGGGLEVYDTSLAVPYWGCQGTYIPDISDLLGAGQSNTTSILANCTDAGNAAEEADFFSINGYDDWYLPSIQELSKVYTNLYSQGLLTVAANVYWSSSQSNPDNAKALAFSDGSYLLLTKNSSNRFVIPVRTF